MYNKNKLRQSVSWKTSKFRSHTEEEQQRKKWECTNMTYWEMKGMSEVK